MLGGCSASGRLRYCASERTARGRARLDQTSKFLCHLPGETSCILEPIACNTYQPERRAILAGMTETAEFKTATCETCGRVARLTKAGWRHGYPPAGHDGHCVGTALFPVVSEAGKAVR